MKSRIKSIILILLVCLTVSACSSNQNGNSTSNNTSGNEDKQQSVTLRFSWWGSESRHTALLEAIDKYMVLNPHVTIEPEYSGFDGYYQKLVTQFAGNTAPDLTPLSVDWIDEIAVKGKLVADLNTLKEYIDLDKFDADFLNEYVVYDGMLVGLPMGANGIATLFNQDFFDKFNIPADTVWNWDNIIQIGKQVHAQDSNAYLLGSVDYRSFLQPYVNQLSGNQWINDDGSLGYQPEHVNQAFEYYQTILNEGVMQPLEESSLYADITENPQWQNGNIGMVFTLSSTISKFKSFTPNLDVSMFPVHPDAKTSAILVNPSNPLAINKNSKHPEEAAKFASWLLTSSDAAVILKDVYSIPAVGENSKLLTEQQLIDPIVAKAVNIALDNAGKPVNSLSNNQELNQIAQDMLERVGFKNIAPTEATDELSLRLTEKLKSTVK